ncbi:hypothetical protein GCM10011613_33460 [Cellvibrio zantedeschiae]|uniref:Uncharacterized protein n=1 Tax=Cellvibrio zantedeschiae TaxID=1237077 RepID=A0ABQ3B9Y4_9GAMM|nr:hypothetical protein [Cellvibrio zantedeschiae]GGY85804.1 hypothetical protein GCM10011613_33460 [Cellvibrio zantedeschiae]
MTRLSIGDVEHNSEDVARKVEGDIAFLTERLHLLEQQQKPNAVILQTYRDMLESRFAVLHWLRQDSAQTKRLASGQ